MLHDTCENTAHLPDPSPRSPEILLSTWWLAEAKHSNFACQDAQMKHDQSIFYQSLAVTQSGMDLASIRVTDTTGINMASFYKWNKIGM